MRMNSGHLEHAGETAGHDQAGNDVRSENSSSTNADCSANGNNRNYSPIAADKRQTINNSNDPNGTKPSEVELSSAGEQSAANNDDCNPDAVITMGGQSDTSALEDDSYSCGSGAMSLSPTSSVAPDEDSTECSSSSNDHLISNQDYSVTYDAFGGVKYPDHHRILILEAAANMVNKQAKSTDEDSVQEDEHSDTSLSTSRPPSRIAKESDDEDRKIFIGGLSFDTSEYDLERYFSRYGIVVMVNLKYDTVTGISRGFAFISFADEKSVDEVLRKPLHIIHGRYIEARRAKSRPVFKKIFVGGIDSSLTEDDIRDYFSRFGKVDEVDIPLDRFRNTRRNFCFIYFDCEEAAEEATMWPRQMIKSRLVDVRKTLPQPVHQQQKRIAQAAGLDLTEFDCNYKFGKMMTTARMVSASAALATHGLATPMPPTYMAAFPGSYPGVPQVSIATNGAIIPFQDHIKSASMAAMAVAARPHSFPAAANFATNCFSNNYCYPNMGHPYAPAPAPNYFAAPAFSSIPLATSYMSAYNYPGVYSMSPVMPSPMSIATPTPAQTPTPSLHSQDPQNAAAALATYVASLGSYGYEMANSTLIGQTSNTSVSTTSPDYSSYFAPASTNSAMTSNVPFYASTSPPAPPSPPPVAPSSSHSDAITGGSMIPDTETAVAAAAATGATISAAAYPYTNGKV